MHRLLVAFLSAFDALVATAAGASAVLAPLTVAWVVAFGDGADWAALWPATGSIWLLGNLVPLTVALPSEYVALAGVDPAAAAFALSLAPLAFSGFVVIFAARSGARAAGAGAWITGVAAGATGYACAAAAIVLTTSNPVARANPWQGILFPALLYAAAALAGAIVAAWRRGDDGLMDRLRVRVDALSGGWADVPGHIARGSAVALAGLVTAAGAAVAVSVAVRGGEVISLFESAQVDALGASLITLGHLAYLPTLIAWALAWLAGPGFALGIGTAVTPAGTQLGLVPGIPMLGLVPERGSPWLLLVLLVPVAVGAVAGWAIRSRMAAARTRPATASFAALGGLVSAPPPRGDEREPVGPRLAAAAGLAVLTGAGAALLAAAASGSIGPGRLAEVGPSPGPVALAVGVEVLVGAAILLFGPVRRRRVAKQDADAGAAVGAAGDASATGDERGAGRTAVDPVRPAGTPPVD